MSADGTLPSVCVFGAGAIGGLIAARLEASGTAVTVAARGPHLEAMRAHGLVLESGGERIVTHPKLVEDASALGAQDYLVLTVKAHSLAPALSALRPLIGPATTIVAAVNGIPWWYCYGLAPPFADRRIRAVDPDGAIWDALPPSQTIGCIVYPAAEVTAPGHVVHGYGDRFSLGEPDGARSERIRGFSELLIGAGFKAPVRPHLRDEIWVKLWGNMAFNPLSVLTGATLDVITTDRDTRPTIAAMMREGQAVAEKLGVRFAIGIEQRIAGGAGVGRHRTSMLQDFERGRPLEIEAVLGAVVELGEWVGATAPLSRAVLGLVRQRVRIRDAG
ncbi:MAG: 2-dehydropantoate 2-reductase [Acetobacteraceae bacterium]